MRFEAQAEAINQRFHQQLDGLWQRFRAWEIPAIMRGLQNERKIALLTLRERIAWERFGERQARKRLRLSLQSKPQGP